MSEGIDVACHKCGVALTPTHVSGNFPHSCDPYQQAKFSSPTPPVEPHSEISELESELAALIPVKQAWVDRGKQITKLEDDVMGFRHRSEHLTMVLRSIVTAVDHLSTTANRKPSSLVHVPKTVIEYARSTLAAIDEEETNGTH